MTKLFEFKLARQPLSSWKWHKDRGKLFASDVAILAGSWDGLWVRAIHGRSASAPQSTEALTERRIIHALGPIGSTLEQWPDDLSGLAALTKKPLLSYAEIRIRDWLLAGAGRRGIEATAELISTRLHSTFPDAHHGLFIGLGHADLILLFLSSSIRDITVMLFELRTLTLKHLREIGAPWLADANLPQSMDARHVVETTHTSLGFFCESLDALTKVGGQLTSKDPCSTFPTVLCSLQPGHEGTPEELRDLLVPEQGRARLEIITGVYDLRISFNVDASTPSADRPRESEVFGWLAGMYRRLFSAPQPHVRNVYTSWGFNPDLAPDLLRPYKPAPGDDSWPHLPARRDDVRAPPKLEKLLGLRWGMLQEFLEMYNSLARSPAFARYLADLDEFLKKLLAALEDAHDSSEDGTIRIYPQDVELVLRRVAIILVGRLAGATREGELELVFGAGMAQQKLAMACSALTRQIAPALVRPDGRETAFLVGFSVIGTARTTRWHWHARPQLMLIELPATEDIRTLLFCLIHEVVRALDLRMVDAAEVRGLIVEELAERLSLRLMASAALLADLTSGRGEETSPPSFRHSMLQIVHDYIGGEHVKAEPDGAAFRSRLRRLMTPAGLTEIVINWRTRALRAPDEVRLTHKGMLEILRMAEDMARDIDEFQHLFAECRADVVAASICGWRHYESFLYDSSARSAGHDQGLGGSFDRRRVEVLKWVRSQGAERGAAGRPEESDRLLHYLKELAFRVGQSLEQTPTRQALMETMDLMRHIERSGGEVTQDVARSVLDLWDRYWLAPAASGPSGAVKERI
jgi:hypothetical protein